MRCQSRATSSHAGSSALVQQWSRRHAGGRCASSQARASAAKASSASVKAKSMSGRRVVACGTRRLPPVCRAAEVWSKPCVTVFAFAYSGEEEAFRTELRAWLAAHLPAEPVPDAEEG